MKQRGASDDGMGIALSRREALGQGCRASAMLALFAATPASLLAGCGERSSVAAIDDERLRSLVLTLANHLIPFTETPGASTAGNADFVLRAARGGLMGVPADMLDRLYADVIALAGRTFLIDPPAAQAAAVARLDTRTFAAKVPAEHAWFGAKALILMSYYTSEGGMSRELRYDLVPGRYDNDLIVDRSFRPLSNDWAAVSVKKKLWA